MNVKMVKVKSTINKDQIIINKEAKSSIKISTFLVTINTNRSDNGLIDFNKLLNQFKAMVKYLFSPDNALRLIKCKECEEACLCKREAFEAKIISVDLKTSIETGPICHKLHSHTFIKVEHKTKVHIDKDRVVAVGKYFMKKIDMAGLYVEVRYVNSGVSKALKYVSHGDEYVPVNDLE
jgi:hypothetical protein